MVEQNIGLGVTNYGVSKFRDTCGGNEAALGKHGCENESLEIARRMLQ